MNYVTFLGIMDMNKAKKDININKNTYSAILFLVAGSVDWDMVRSLCSPEKTNSSQKRLSRLSSISTGENRLNILVESFLLYPDNI